MINRMWAARASAVDTTRYFGAHWKDRLPGAQVRASTALTVHRLADQSPKTIPMAAAAYTRDYTQIPQARTPMGRQLDIYA